MTTATKHTPGPWTVQERGIGAEHIKVQTMEGLTVARCTSTPDRSINSAEANARLIAEAPAMREALALAEATIVRLNRHDSANGTLEVIRALLARIDGCTHNNMVERKGDPSHAWQCADCGHVYGARIDGTEADRA